MMGISVWQLALILLIVVVLFGTKRFRSGGANLGGAIGGFHRSFRESPAEHTKDPENHPSER